MRGLKHPISIKEKSLDLRKRGFSYNQIVSITKIPKTTIQNWLFPIVLSKKAKNRINNRIKNGTIKGNTSHKRLSIKLIPDLDKWSNDLIFIVAHFMFDGGARHDGYAYYSKDKSQIDRMRKKMKAVFDFMPYCNINDNGVIRDVYYSRDLLRFISSKKKEIVKYIVNASKKHKQCFLKAFFDDEGSVCFDQKYNNRKVRGFQDSNKLLELIKKLLLDFGIKSRIEGNEIVISDETSIIKFQKEINFSSKIFFNSKRKNSIWKKDIEKRTLLNKIVKSYLN